MNYLYASARDLNSSSDGLVVLKCESMKGKLDFCFHSRLLLLFFISSMYCMTLAMFLNIHLAFQNSSIFAAEFYRYKLYAFFFHINKMWMSMPFAFIIMIKLYLTLENISWMKTIEILKKSTGAWIANLEKRKVSCKHF